MLTTKEEIEDWLKINNITNYTINDILGVCIHEDVNLSHQNLTEIPIQFDIVEGRFNCSHNQLTSLKGCPQYTYEFNCSFNPLASLEYFPESVNENVYCDDDKLLLDMILHDNLKEQIATVILFPENQNILELLKEYYIPMYAAIHVPYDILRTTLRYEKLNSLLAVKENKESKKLKV